MSHTPAPWAVNSISLHDGSIGIAAGRCVVASVHNGVSIGDVMFGREPAEQMANAQLISAAPDLLAALQALWNGGYLITFSGSESEAETKQAAIAAIHKATGAA